MLLNIHPSAQPGMNPPLLDIKSMDSFTLPGAWYCFSTGNIAVNRMKPLLSWSLLWEEWDRQFQTMCRVVISAINTNEWGQEELEMEGVLLMQDGHVRSF